MSTEHKKAFTKSFMSPSLFWQVGQHLRLKKASAECVYGSSHDPLEGLAFGEEADVLVLAPAVDELTCLRQFLQPGIKPIPSPRRSALKYECWTKRGEKHVVLATIGEGHLSAAVTTTLLLQRFKPRSVILMGVAGVIPKGREKCEIGDVVIGQTTIWYEWGGVSEKRRGTWRFTKKSDIDTVWGGEKADRPLYQMASKWSGKQLEIGMTAADRPVGISQPPKVALGIVGSGSKIVASQKFIQDVIYRADRKINTFETEAAGVCQACHDFPEHHIDILVVRGIMDKADERTRKDKLRKLFRDYARTSCAKFVSMLLDKL